MLRLTEVFGGKHYTSPRLKVIRQSVRHLTDAVFERSVTRLIATKRTPPLLVEILEAADTVQAEDSQRMRENAPYQPGGFLGELRVASGKNETADPEYVRLCMRTLEARLTGKLNREAFYEATESLDSLARQIDPGGTPRNIEKINNRWEFVK